MADYLYYQRRNTFIQEMCGILGIPRKPKETLVNYALPQKYRLEGKTRVISQSKSTVITSSLWIRWFGIRRQTDDEEMGRILIMADDQHGSPHLKKAKIKLIPLSKKY